MYGLSIAQLDYTAAVGLTLNSDRARVRKIWDAATALSVNDGTMEVPDEWSEMLTDTPEEATKFRHQQMLADGMAAARNRS